MAAGTSAVAAVNPITAVAGPLLSWIGGLFGQHTARVKGATDENHAVDEMVAGFDYAMKTIFDQANSGQLSASDAMNACEAVMQQWWQLAAPFESEPGTARTGCVDKFSGTGPGEYGSDGTVCNKQCTALCCVGCNPIGASIQNAIYVFQTGGGKARMQKVFGTPKYGSHDRETYYLTYTPPPLSSIGGITNELTDLLGLTGQNTGYQGNVGQSLTSGLPGSSTVVYIVIAVVFILIVALFRR